MNKTLFDRLLYPYEAVSLDRSVIENIRHIFRAQGFLDGDKELNEDEVKVLPYISDVSSLSSMEADRYKKSIRKLIMRFEPRVKNVEVKFLRKTNIDSECHLLLDLDECKVEHTFTF